jgi:hypothetical protein
MLRIEPRVVARTERMCDRLQSYQNTGEVVNLTNVLSSLTTDVILSIIFDEPSDYPGGPNLNDQWYDTLKKATRSTPLFKRMPWMIG